MARDLKRSTRYILLGLGLAMTAAAGGFGWMVVQSCLPGSTRIVSAIGVCLLLAVPLRVLFVALRRKRTTGQWSITEAERQQIRSRASAKVNKPWLFPLLSAVLIVIALLNLWIQGSALVHGPVSAFAAALGVFWAFLLVMQSRLLWKELRSLSESSRAA